MHKKHYIVGIMKHKTLYGSILAAGIIAAVICVGMVTGFSVAKPFISVDPVGDKNVGDAFTITGTTNLPAGTEILAEVYPSVYEDQTGTGSGEFTGATGSITVSGGPGSTNTWEFHLDTSTFKPMEYLVTISSFKGDPSKGDYTKGDIFGTTRFTVNPGSGTAGTSRSSDHVVAGGILIDPIHDTTAGDLLLVTGKTNLSVGTPLIVKVIPDSMDNESIRRNYQNPEIAAETHVVKGSGPNNLFSVSLDTRSLLPAEHLLLISDVKGNATGTGSEPGSFTGSALFNILPGTSGTGSSGNDTGQYIKIDPIADKTTGDLLIVTGSTNLPEGTTLNVEAGSLTNILVRRGSNGVNQFSSPVDTSIMKPGTKTITVYNMIGDPAKGDYRPGTVKATTSFTLNGAYLGADTRVYPTITKDDYIHLNAIGDRSAGEQFLITGTTSLPVGTTLLWQIMPDTGTPPASTNKTALGVAGNNPVTKGDGTANRVSFAADMDLQAPGKWVVLVGEVKGDTFEIGDPYGYAYFTLK